MRVNILQGESGIVHAVRILCMAILLWFFPAFGIIAVAETIYDSPYVDFSPDGMAWTTNAGEKEYRWYREGTKITTGIGSSIRPLEAGEHYYKKLRSGIIPVGKWEVVYRTGTCIHNDYPKAGQDWHGVDFGRHICRGYYFSGWNAYCADCGDRISPMHFYMSAEAAATLHYLEAGMGKEYYYLCPRCGNLEMGSPIMAHSCNAISLNRYKVHYDANTIGPYGGYMEDSIHMYDNATEYEGCPVTPLKQLTGNTYTRTGYEFAGWNTMPDGSGEHFADRAKVQNLTEENYEPGGQKGIVTLYAIWRPSACTLQIDPNGGAYRGCSERTVLTGEYLETCLVGDGSEGTVTPPAGYTVSFDTGGGNLQAPVTGTTHFAGWLEEQPFAGRFREGVYYFTAPDGNTDTLRASYEADPVVLPLPTKGGSSFGGWYHDREFQKLAGYAGEEVVPGEDMVLYARWVELKLSAENNDTANAGKGAVDLSWSQPDHKDKVYLLYQSRDGENWYRIYSALELGEEKQIEVTGTYTGDERKWKAPYTGLYRIVAKGAAGGSLTAHKGGAGGRMTVTAWLTKGEEVTCYVGGSGISGTFGGGTGSLFANGGGRTMIVTDQKGILAVAGGGGGASSLEDGGAGGALSGLRSDGKGEGGSGQAGGGAGAIGGVAGEVVIHHHDAGCYREIERNLFTEDGVFWNFYREEYGEEDNLRSVIQCGSVEKLIPVEEGMTLELEVIQSLHYGSGFHGNYMEDSYVAVYDQCGRVLFWGDAACEKYESRWDLHYERDEEDDIYLEEEHWIWGSRNSPEYWIRYDDSKNILEHSGNYSLIPPLEDPVKTAEMFGATTYFTVGSSWYGTRGRVLLETVKIPQGTTGIYIESLLAANDEVEHGILRAKLSGERKLVCGYTEGQILSSRQAYGGSSYANEEYCDYRLGEAGVNEEQGSFGISSEFIGFLEENRLDGVEAGDHAPPEGIEETSCRRKILGEQCVQVTWQEPKDRGTEYFHKVESYQTGTFPWGQQKEYPQSAQDCLCSSNVTRNVLTVGIDGYYYLLDGEEGTEVTLQNGTFLRERELTLHWEEDLVWLHLAAVDKAGNLSRTLHLNIDPAVWGGRQKIFTEKMDVEECENVWYDRGIFYVRSDGATPFSLEYAAGMEGVACQEYRIAEAVFENGVEGRETASLLLALEEPEGFEAGEGFSFRAEGDSLLAFYPFTEIKEKEEGRRLKITQQFLLEEAAHGQLVRITPRAGAVRNNVTADTKTSLIEYSDAQADLENGILIMGDGEAPVIRGMEKLEGLEIIDRDQGDILLEITAEDSLSGVAELSVEICNQDNALRRVIKWNGEDSIRVELTQEDPVFSGDFTVSVYAVDHVGNARRLSASTMGFALEAEIFRILEPHDPVFQCGESGVLKISLWGYVDRLEVAFPAEIFQGQEVPDTVFDYTDRPCYFREEELEFMVPLYAPQGESFPVTVRAYKGERRLEEHPALAVLSVGGSVLYDIRSRLR